MAETFFGPRLGALVDSIQGSIQDLIDGFFNGDEPEVQDPLKPGELNGGQGSGSGSGGGGNGGSGNSGGGSSSSGTSGGSSSFSFGFLQSRGCLAEVKIKDCNTSGLYSVADLPAYQLTDGQILFIDTIDVTHEDAALPKDALNDKHALYLYGTTFSKMSIRGTIFFGEVCKGSSGNIIQILTNWFNTNRVTKSKKPVNVSISDKYKASVFIVALNFGQADPRLNSIKFTIHGLVKPTAQIGA